MHPWVSRDPGRALLVLALLVATALYLPTLALGLVNYDDWWLYQNNHVVRDLSWQSVTVMFTDLDAHSPARYALTPEYLPVRDLSVMLDFAVWGEQYGGFHVTNLVLYLLAITLVFAMLDAFGCDRTIVGIAVLLWAVHPVHVESVAWLSERKGLLGIVFASLAGLGYARFRAGRSARWLIVAALAAVAAVWSKAPAAFTVAALAGLEVVLPARRVSWRRSLAGLATIGVVGVLAYIPVVVVAMGAEVVGESAIPGGRVGTVLGVHGFYLQLAAMTMPNAVSYPIANGPGVLDVVLGALGAIAVALPFVPRLRARPDVRAAAVIWLFAWLPVGHLLLPLHMVAVADRYALVMVLGFTLAIAAGVRAIERPRLQIALVTVLVIAAGLRSLDARTGWTGDVELWRRAVASNPRDADAWSAYAGALAAAGDRIAAARAIATGAEYGESPRLVFRRAMLLVADGDGARARVEMRRAAVLGLPLAMVNLAVLEHADGLGQSALGWARASVRVAPMNADAHRARGVIALDLGHADEAIAALERVIVLAPSPLDRFALGFALHKLGRTADAIRILEQCVDDPGVGPRARRLLVEARGG